MAPRIPKKPTSKEILDSFLNQSGFLLEQEISSFLEGRGYRVWTNHPYVDQDQGIEREVDIVAIKELTLDEYDDPSKICICLVCQCKNNSYPLVALSRKKNQADKKRSPEQYFFPCIVRNRRLEKIDPAFFRFGLNQFHHYYKIGNDIKSVLVCGMLPKNPKNPENKDWNVKNMDHDLILPVIKPYLGEREAYKLDQKTLDGLDTVEFMKHEERNNIWLFFPMVIVGGPLFEINTSKSPLKAVQVKHVTVLRKMKTKYYEGTFLIEFIHESFLGKFLDNVLEPFVQKVKEKAKDLM